MEKNLLNKNHSSQGIFFCCLSLVLVITSCNPTKYVLQNESLLNKNHVVINNEGLSKADIEPYIKPKPNKRIFGARFHLGLYNLSNIDKDNWFHRWLRNIGEEPVIYDEYQTDKSREQISEYLFSKGYFDSDVSETVETLKKESKVYYNVDSKEPYTIRNIKYNFQDTSLYKLFVFDSVNCLIERTQPYDEDVLKDERSRFERFVKDEGFYSFSDDDIFFAVDSSLNSRQVDIVYEVRNFNKVDSNNRVVQVPHEPYSVRDVYIYPDFIPRDVLEGGEAYMSKFDTTYYKGFYFISQHEGKPEVKYDLILQSLYVSPGSLFNVTNTEQTETHLLALKVFRLVHVFYNEVEASDKNGIKQLDCVVQLTMMNQQSYKIELEGTNTSGDLGGALGVTYTHNNLFRGAEQFNLSLKGAYEVVTQQEATRNTQEYSMESSLKWPKFIMPFPSKENIVKKYNPSTSFTGAFNYQNMPMYARTMGNGSFGYNWSRKSFSTYIANPLQFNVINIITIDPSFRAMIERSPYLASAYTDVVVIGGAYSYVFTNQSVKKASNYLFFRFNFEPAGNLLNALGSPLKLKNSDGRYHVFNQPFAQYIKADVDIRYNVKYSDVSSMAYRLFLGAGVPYGNSQAMPFEKQYYGGGANGIRAWQVRTLGPGSYLSSESGFLNQTGDIKIEANAEYRFKLFWVLEGALFLDAGNIWSVNYDVARPGSQFKINQFYDDIAVGSGLGLRFDFNFVLLRTDLGVKLRDPAIIDGSKWIAAQRSYSFKDDFTFVIAIGYPF